MVATEAVVLVTSITACPIVAKVVTADVVAETLWLGAELTLAVVVTVFDGCAVTAAIGEPFTTLVTVLLTNLVFPRPAPGLKSFELLTMVAKLGKGPCSTAMFAGTLWTGLLAMELGTGRGMLWSGEVDLSRSCFSTATLRDLDKGLRGLPGPENNTITTKPR